MFKYNLRNCGLRCVFDLNELRLPHSQISEAVDCDHFVFGYFNEIYLLINCRPNLVGPRER